MNALLVAAARMFPLCLAVPLGPPSVRLVFGGALASAVAASMPAAASTGVSTEAGAAILALEVVVGLTLGLGVAALFAGAEAAGGRLDEARRPPGIAPLAGHYRKLHAALALALFAGVSGPCLLVDALGRSYVAVPVGAARLGAGAESVISSVAGLLLSAVAIATPVLAAMLIADVALALAARAAPSIARRLSPTGGMRQLSALLAVAALAAVTSALISDGMRDLGRDVLAAARGLGG